MRWGCLLFFSYFHFLFISSMSFPPHVCSFFSCFSFSHVILTFQKKNHSLSSCVSLYESERGLWSSGVVGRMYGWLIPTVCGGGKEKREKSFHCLSVCMNRISYPLLFQSDWIADLNGMVCVILYNICHSGSICRNTATNSQVMT
ncbi:hypothetical protein L873DRAFT_617442 [Choiromyces venosus 120613-1]|uniref:Secreted protein n=1 Tax=Choiromyces venosus 120613-1 TaxID=1336337 RepID=A0A3N4IXX7_9PEZI|nr:hypothetical protein L873DRAFT_617442 [Choiromyces venosus 120613-1]